MSITILPARLANQIAAGEVVERPASVVKELVENSLDAGATHIQIDIEKGGTKRIRIIDNGKGIVENELTLALSRHATSKIKNLDDLEAISSLGFRGEALASISSVARLTLTSKPVEQELAWQAYAEGRDMDVVLKPAAHPNGTTIDVVDLFFNTPARRKFLRTEKTEFTHIEEVIKRIALARFDVSFILTHNGKQIKQYRKIVNAAQNIKRIAAVCGQSFVDHAIEINCQHDDIHLAGWVAKPSYTRKQNDLSYSYVNGRMMRDKLINHAIRQAYGEFIDNDVYSAFVLFLSVDYKDVDVNVHPAKHEVRFHQSRYVHDFIYSVCHKALTEQVVTPLLDETSDILPSSLVNYSNTHEQDVDRSYVQPLQTKQQVQENTRLSNYTTNHQQNFGSSKVSPKAAANYQTLMSVDLDRVDITLPNTQHSENSNVSSVNENQIDSTDASVTSIKDTRSYLQLDTNKELAQNLNIKLLFVHEEKYIVYQHVHQQQSSLKLCLISPLALNQQYNYITDCWQENAEHLGIQSLISQPLLLPVKIRLEPSQKAVLKTYQHLFFASGIHFSIQQNNIQIRQFPALLRAKDVTHTFEQLLLLLMQLHEQLLPEKTMNSDFLIQWQQCLAELSVPSTFTLLDVQQLWKVLISSEKINNEQLNSLLNLNSVLIDLTSLASQLNNRLADK